MASFLLCVVFLLVGEAFCRIFLDINLRKTSRSFLVQNEEGRIVGNARNSAGVSFGVPVHSDDLGFRISPGYAYPKSDEAVLFVGDSVTFGVGVPEEDTFVGLFRKSVPDKLVYNASVVGYSLVDYKRVIRDFVPAHPEVKDVYLVYCLNDLFDEAALKPVPAQEDAPLKRSFKDAVRWGFRAANEWLGSSSKLYVYITGMTADPSLNHFLSDRKLHERGDEEFRRVAGQFVEIAEALNARGIRLTVLINPYEMQLREPTDVNLAPQRRIEAFLSENGIRWIDTMERFRGFDRSTDAFLFADPMHLNGTGHRVVHEALVADRTR